jgi:8-oxo-dGTP diphosphatase
VTVLLVRHAKAGSRQRWQGADEDRPLSKAGLSQARGLVKAVAPYRVARILSSPFVRCVQSVEPVAAACRLEIERHEALAEGRAAEALDLVRRLAGGPPSVLCTHGDIVPEVLHHLAERDGLDLGPAPRWQKGSTWVLAAADGRFAEATYLPPQHGES